MFSRISGTTAISGAVDTSLTLVEQERGSGEATLYCIGRDIEYCELELTRNAENVWELHRDSRTLPKGGRLVLLLSELMNNRSEFIGTPTELTELIDPVGAEQISPRKISREVLKSLSALRESGIEATVRRSNGRRLIELRRADSVDTSGGGNSVPIVPTALASGAAL